MEGRNLYFYSLALRGYRQRVLEERSWSNWRNWFRLTLLGWELDRKLSVVELRSADLISGGTGIVDLLRPFGPRSLDRPWLAPGLWRLFGAGPVGVGVEKLLDQVKPEEKLQKTYLQAIQGETLIAQGDWKGAEDVLNHVLQDLPARDVALRTRSQANMARTLEAQGHSQEALHYWRQVMERDPSLLRQFEVQLPIHWQAGGGLAAEAVSRLRKSPRFRTDEGAFAAEVDGDGDGLSARLLGPDGSVIKTFSSPAGKDNEETLTKFCQEFHDQVFAPVVDLTQFDIYSINSSPTVSTPKDMEKMMKSN
jgi:tetratricopeptide (TPR) repeat protein